MNLKIAHATCNLLRQSRYLIRLEAARHAVLVDAAAAIGEAAFTNVLPGAGSVDVTAAVHQQVFSLADVACKNTKHVNESVSVVTVW